MKKSSSAVSGLSAIVKPQPFGGWLTLSDDEDEFDSPPAQKKSRSDLNYKDHLKDKSHSFEDEIGRTSTHSSPLAPKQIGLAFEEPSPVPCGSGIPDELQYDIDNGEQDHVKVPKPDIEDFCSSSSEFEIDDEDSFEWEDFEQQNDDALKSANESVTSQTIAPLHTSVASDTQTQTQSASVQSSPLPSASPPLRSPFIMAPKAQASITNYFGIVKGEVSITTSNKTVSMANSKKRPVPTPAPKHATLTSAISRISSTEENSEPNKKSYNYWTREAPIRDTCPFYKRIAGTTFTVDSFQCQYRVPATKSFFLTHFHSDHYGGLNSKFTRGLIYCSPITAALVISQLRVDARYVHSIPMNTPTLVEGVEVTLFDANHCPGAAIMLFKLADGTLHLHTGDFRFDSTLPEHLSLLNLQGKIANLYLDSTYANPQYTFPPQQLVISSVLDLIEPYARDPNTLFLVGTYTIGKERMFLSLAERFGLKFYAKPSKMKILKCLEIDHVLREYATDNELEARIHIVPIFDLSLQKLGALFDELPLITSATESGQHQSSHGSAANVRPRWNRIVAIRPTGWAYSSPKKGKAKKGDGATSSIAPFLHATSPQRKKSAKPETTGISTVSSRRGAITIHSCPYSEHSSFSELSSFVRALKPRWIIPTVNNRSREEVMEMVSNLRG